MSFLCLLLLASSPPARPAQAAPAPAPDLAAQLDEIARVGSVMVDGDLCRRIVTERGLMYMFKVDARDQWVAGIYLEHLRQSPAGDNPPAVVTVPHPPSPTPNPLERRRP